MSTKEERTARAAVVDARLDDLEFKNGRAVDTARAELCIELAALLREGIDAGAAGIDDGAREYILETWEPYPVLAMWQAEYDAMRGVDSP